MAVLAREAGRPALYLVLSDAMNRYKGNNTRGTDEKNPVVMSSWTVGSVEGDIIEESLPPCHNLALLFTLDIQSLFLFN